MIGHGVESLVFGESLGAETPACLDAVASACWAGWRLVRPPTPCLENVVLGCRRLPQFRDARRSALRREMRWHFRAERREAMGATTGVRGWRERWESDAALRRTVRAHPAFAAWRDGLAERLLGEPLVALAAEGSRSCYGRLRGDAATLGAMHAYMEEGGI